MDTEVSDLEYLHKINSAVDAAYRGLPIEFHMRLGKKIAHFIGIWVNPEHLEDALNDIAYARRVVDVDVSEDSQRDRYGNPN